MEEEDKDLLARYRQGDVDALAVLVERYRRPLFSFILRMTEGKEDADEIFQEVWVRVIRKIDSYRNKSFISWLFRIAHNLVIDRARRRKKFISLDGGMSQSSSEDSGIGRDSTLSNVLPSASPRPSSVIEATELGEKISRAVDELPAEQKTVFVMRTTGELRFREIAESQGLSINTVLARMHYALSKLRIVLQEDYAMLGVDHEM